MSFFPIIAAVGVGLVTFFSAKKAQGITQPIYDPTYGPQLPAAGAQVNPRDLDTLARTLWGEARGEGATGMQAVANVIMNRFALALLNPAYARQFGATVTEICKKPYQFSAWLSNDPNLPKMLSVTSGDPQFRDALNIAEQALKGRLPDITGGADHYHTKAVTPSWSAGVVPVRIIGVHKFYRLAPVAVA